MTWRNLEDLDLKAWTKNASQFQKLSVEVTKKASTPKDAFFLSFQDNLQGHHMEKENKSERILRHYAWPIKVDAIKQPIQDFSIHEK